jgi:hypothetical protein
MSGCPAWCRIVAGRDTQPSGLSLLSEARLPRRGNSQKPQTSSLSLIAVVLIAWLVIGAIADGERHCCSGDAL